MAGRGDPPVQQVGHVGEVGGAREDLVDGRDGGVEVGDDLVVEVLALMQAADLPEPGVDEPDDQQEDEQVAEDPLGFQRERVPRHPREATALRR